MIPDQDDRDLAQRHRAGDPAAFEEIVAGADTPELRRDLALRASERLAHFKQPQAALRVAATNDSAGRSRI